MVNQLFIDINTSIYVKEEIISLFCPFGENLTSISARLGTQWQLNQSVLVALRSSLIPQLHRRLPPSVTDSLFYFIAILVHLMFE